MCHDLLNEASDNAFARICNFRLSRGLTRYLAATGGAPNAE